MNILTFTALLSKINTGEQLYTDEMLALSGIGSMKFLLYDWSSDAGWTGNDRVHFKHMAAFEKELTVFANNRHITYESLQRSIREAVMSSYYTPMPIIDAMIDAVKILEIHGEPIKTILDPSAGSGRFIYPLADIFHQTSILGIEKEPITSEFAKAYLGAHCSNVKVINNIYESAPYDRKYDLIISNIPFANVGVVDMHIPSGIKKFQKSLHGFYFAKSIELLNPGGVLCFVTSTGIMDSSSHRELREYIAHRSDLISAVRLPDNIFASEKTHVTSDVIILRKPMQTKRKLSKVDELFISEAAGDLFSNDVQVNPYFNVFTNNVLGTFIKGNQYSADRGMSVVSELSVIESAAELRNILTQSCTVYAQKYMVSRTKTVLSVTSEQSTLFAAQPDNRPSTVYIDNIYDRQGNIIEYNRDGGYAVKLGEIVDIHSKEYYAQYIDKSQLFSRPIPNSEDIIDGIIRLRRLTQYILTNKQSHDKHSEVKSNQILLNKVYDELVEKSGGISLTQILKYSNFEDVDNGILYSLENNEPGENQYHKSSIFTVEFIADNKYIPKGIEDAILHAYNKKGYIDADYIAEITGQSKHEVITKALATDIVRYDPLSPTLLSFPDTFKSGHIANKINVINTLLSGDKPDYLSTDILLKHLKELKTVQPEFVPIEKIQPQIGEVMFDVKIYEQFFADYIGINPLNIAIYNQDDVVKITLRDAESARLANSKLSVKTLSKNKFYGVDMIEAIVGNKQQYFQHNVGTEKSPRYVADHFANGEFARIKEDLYRQWEKFYKNNTAVKTHVEGVYNQTNAFVPKEVDGSYLDLSELTNINIKARDYQRAGIASIIENNGALIDYPTGAGKTIVMAVAAIKMKRAGIVKKPLLIGIIANIEAINQEVRCIYPDAKVLYADADSYSKQNRPKFFAKIAMNDWDLIIMSHSQFDKIPLNIEAQIDVYNEEFQNIMSNISVLKQIESSNVEQHLTKRQLKGLHMKATRIQNELENLSKNTDSLSLDVVKMGIDHILADEAHMFKNLQFETRHSRVAGLSNSGSERAAKLNIHLHAIRKKFYENRDKGFTFVSATPITNSIAEMYTLFRLSAPSKLKKLKLQNFDKFIQTFARFDSDLEITVTGKYSYKTRCRYFIKVDLLMKLYRDFAHIVTPSQVNIATNLPKVKTRHITIARTEEQEQYLYDLLEFAGNGDRYSIERNPSDKDSNGAEMLLVSGRSVLASIDMRLIDESVYADYCDRNKATKLNVLCENVAEIYFKEEQMKGAQLIFSNIGTPSKDKKVFDIYNAIKNILCTKYNIPSNEIAFIHDYNEDEHRMLLERRVNAGQVRIVLGSTQKLGTGINMQERLKAIHNVDIPWIPTDFQQRLGRMERPGNKYSEVENYFYSTEKTLDAFKFEVLKHKQVFINQTRYTKQFEGSAIEDTYADGNDIRYVDMVAEITGNPYIKELATTEREYERCNATYRHVLLESGNIDDMILSIESSLKQAHQKISYLSRALTIYDGYKDSLKGEEMTYVLHHSDIKCTEQQLGEAILAYTQDTKNWSVSTTIADIYKDDVVFACVKLRFIQGVDSHHEIRVAVFDKNEQVADTSYNKGRIAVNPITVGANPRKALDNISVAKQFYESKIEEYADKIKVLNERKIEYAPDRVTQLREKTVTLFSRIKELRGIVSQNSAIFIDESKRIKYSQIKDTTFSKALEIRDNEKKVVNKGIKIDI